MLLSPSVSASISLTFVCMSCVNEFIFSWVCLLLRARVCVWSSGEQWGINCYLVCCLIIVSYHIMFCLNCCFALKCSRNLSGNYQAIIESVVLNRAVDVSDKIELTKTPWLLINHARTLRKLWMTLLIDSMLIYDMLMQFTFEQQPQRYYFLR